MNKSNKSNPTIKSIELKGKRCETTGRILTIIIIEKMLLLNTNTRWNLKIWPLLARVAFNWSYRFVPML